MDLVTPLRAKLDRPVAKHVIEVVDEKQALAEALNVFWKSATLPKGEHGLWSLHRPVSQTREKDLKKRLRGHTAGDPLPDWHDGAGGAMLFDTYVCRVRNVMHTPEFGAVIDGDGRLYRRTVAEARYFTPTLGQLPGMRVKQDRLMFDAPRDPPRLAAATVFIPWGARFNYGHFVLDALTGLAVIDDMGALESHPPIAPVLNAWQRELLSLYLGDRAGLVRELDAPIVRLDDVVFTNCMDHFLHAPNKVLKLVRDRIIESARRAAPEQAWPWKIYLARHDRKRVMVNQDKLIRMLRERGYEIVFPEKLSVAEQVMLISQAKVIVGATGAGFANVLFAAPDARIFEIQPTNFTGIWVRQICDVVGLEWFGYFSPSPLEVRDFYTEGKRRDDVTFAYRLPHHNFIEFLDRNTGGL